MCAGAANGDGHVAPVHAKVVAPTTLTEKNTMVLTHFASKMSMASWGLLGASWVSPGAFWVLPGCLLGAKVSQDHLKYTVWGLTPGSYIYIYIYTHFFDTCTLP